MHSDANCLLLLAQLVLCGTCVPVDLGVVADNKGHAGVAVNEEGDTLQRQPPAAVDVAGVVRHVC